MVLHQKIEKKFTDPGMDLNVYITPFIHELNLYLVICV
jgi:hypothetical protein